MKKLLLFIVPFLLAGDCGGADIPTACEQWAFGKGYPGKKEQDEKPHYPRDGTATPAPSPSPKERRIEIIRTKAEGFLDGCSMSGEYVVMSDGEEVFIPDPNSFDCNPDPH